MQAESPRVAAYRLGGSCRTLDVTALGQSQSADSRHPESPVTYGLTVTGLSPFSVPALSADEGESFPAR
jgi:hypothetical protein